MEDEWMQRLQAHVTDIEQLKVKLQTELEALDWPDIFRHMDSLEEDDESWTPLPLDWRDRLANPDLVNPPTKALAHPTKHEFSRAYVDAYWQVQRQEENVFGPLVAIMRTKWESVDECERPSSLMCEECGWFSISVSKSRDHVCPKVLQCETCGHKSSTPERHRAHVQSKHMRKWAHICKTCDFNTDSKSQYDRHLASKKHKEQVTGSPLPTAYYCDACSLAFKFKSEYERHQLTKRHGKTLVL